MTNRNKERTQTFMTIRGNILKSTNYLHLIGCQQMIENSTPILDRDELTILMEYFNDKEKQLAPLN